MSSRPHLSRRQLEILRLVQDVGRVAVEELSERLGVTPQTIRRDLNELGEARLVARIHGGAMVATGVENITYEARKHVAPLQKRLIGEATAKLIPNNSSLFINIGTTPEAAAKALSGHTGLLVITNNLHVAMELHPLPHIRVVMCGGGVRGTDGGVVGLETLNAIRQFRVDTAIIGASAIDIDGSLLDFDFSEVMVTREIIANARRVLLVADSSKFARTAPVLVAKMTDIDVLVTDRAPSQEAAALCAQHDVELIEAAPDPAPEGEAIDSRDLARRAGPG